MKITQKQIKEMVGIPERTQDNWANSNKYTNLAFKLLRKEAKKRLRKKRELNDR